MDDERSGYARVHMSTERPGEDPKTLDDEAPRLQARHWKELLCLLWLLGSCTSTSPGSTSGGAALERVGFPERAQWSSMVLHLDWTELGGPRRLSSVLRQTDRVELSRPEGQGWGIHARGEDGAFDCPVAVYVNGIRSERAQRAGSQLDLDELVAPRTLDGLELHLGPDGPVRTAGGCGSLLLWTEAFDDSHPFRGQVVARVEGPAADTVTRAVLHPIGLVGTRDGRRFYFSVVPGTYEVAFLSGMDELDVRPVRVFAYQEAHVTLEVRRTEGDPSS